MAKTKKKKVASKRKVTTKKTVKKAVRKAGKLPNTAPVFARGKGKVGRVNISREFEKLLRGKSLYLVSDDEMVTHEGILNDDGTDEPADEEAGDTIADEEDFGGDAFHG